MLDHGVIQQSFCPYFSPVLLVQKNDKTWRFFVDYRHVNAIMVKNRFPLHIIDELLDELAGAKWFTSLHLRVGYHQIRLQLEDKTAFYTHHGKFRVMPYGLTNTPAIFKNALNTVLAPLLHRGVLVFIDDILVYSLTVSRWRSTWSLFAKC